MKLNSHFFTTTLMMTLFMTGCGSTGSQTKQLSTKNTQQRSASVADRVFSPINIGGGTRSKNIRDNSNIDAIELVGTLAIAGGSFLYANMPTAETTSLIPASSKSGGLVNLSETHIDDIVRRFYTKVHQFAKSAGESVVTTDVKIIYNDIHIMPSGPTSAIGQSIEGLVETIERLENQIKVRWNVTVPNSPNIADDALRAGNAELEILAKAKTTLHELTSNPQSKVFIKDAATAANLRTVLEKVQTNQSFVKSISMTSRKVPIMGQTGTYIRRILYVVVALDIGNDVYHGFDQRTIGLIGR